MIRAENDFAKARELGYKANGKGTEEIKPTGIGSGIGRR
jgi:hypothetical protein